ncbi:unnamed protein product [Ectocarpus sp. 6 AP-2014]
MKFRALSACALACPSACLAFLSSSPLPRVGNSPDMRRRRSQSTSLDMTVTKAAKDMTVAVAGSTGYIGKFVALECVRRGYKTIALTRNPDAVVEGAEMVVADVTDPASVDEALAGRKIDGLVSCLASRSGTKSDSFAIDYQATLNCLETAKKEGAAHFVMLSAFCVKNPILQFQKAKLKFEEKLVEAGNAGEIGYSIVRPTAFFKSVSGQLEVVQGGAPFVVFGDGTMCKCNPIAEADLATYLVDCITEKSRNNKVLNIGGPDAGLTMTAQGKLLFEAVGKEPKILKVPVLLFDVIIGALDFLAGILPKQFEDPAELAKIGKYYAVEDMLTVDPSEKASLSWTFGTVTLGEHYKRIAVEGNDYDPYTTLFAGKKNPTSVIANLVGNSVDVEEEQPVAK